MRLITGFLFFINLIAWISFDILCWSLTGITLGIIVLIGIISFLVAWKISVEAIFAPLDYISQSEWDIFIKKIKWANSTCLISMIIFALICIIFNWFHLKEFLEISI